MPRSEADKKGVRSLLAALLKSDTLGPPLVAKAAEVRPGTPQASRQPASGRGGQLTEAQRFSLTELVAKGPWKQLSPEQRKGYAEGREVADCPFVSVSADAVDREDGNGSKTASASAAAPRKLLVCISSARLSLVP